MTVPPPPGIPPRSRVHHLPWAWMWIGALLAAVGLFGCTWCGALWLLSTMESGPWRPEAPAPTVVLLPTATPSPTATPYPTATLRPPATVPFQAVAQIVALTAEGRPAWTGSASIISADGLLLTSAHNVLALAPDEPPVADILVLLSPREDQPPEPRFYAQVLQADPDLDLAVLRIDRDANGNPVDPAELNLPHLRLGDPQALRLGDELTILGYPGIGGNTITLTKGEVAGFVGEAPYGPRAYIKTSATLAGGNSGGAVLNAQGALVAVPILFGAGEDETEIVDCRPLVDTNRDGALDERDACVPLGGFINALRPVDLALPLIAAARRGEVAVPPPPPTPATNGPAAIEQPTGPLLLHEDFDSPVIDWKSPADDPEVRVRFAQGHMFVRLLLDDYLHVFTAKVTPNADVLLQVQAQVTHATGDGEFGLLCRYQDLDNFYAAAVVEDGAFYVFKYHRGEYTQLHPLAPLPRGTRFAPETWNHITFACVGPHLTLFVNGVRVITVTDTDLPSGDVGLAVGTYLEPDFEVAFDDFKVWAARP